MRLRSTGKALLAGLVIGGLLVVAPAAWASHIFNDVPDDKFYADAVEWAAENGLTTGRSPTIFDPEAAVTRGESVTFLKRFNDYLAAGGVPQLQGPPGPQGDPGVQGPPGPQGDPGSLSGITTRSQNVVLTAGSSFSVPVACLTGEYVVGGGWQDPSGANETSIRASYPVVFPGGSELWWVAGTNEGIGIGNVNIYARCVAI